MPDKVFEKGKAGKRCTLFLKYSFYQNEGYIHIFLQRSLKLKDKQGNRQIVEIEDHHEQKGRRI